MKKLQAILYAGFILCILFIAACSEKETPDAHQIVDQAIAAHGGQHLDKAVVTFKFRDRQYRALRDNGAFVYSRTFTEDSTGQRIHDVMSNSGFKRTADDAEIELPEERQKAYTSSVNGVIYFALLPYFLNDAAVQKEYLGEATVNGEPYHKVKVTFAQEGGGEDYEDVYVYWFHQQKNTMDYLAYSFKEEDGTEGSRFREAVNPRKVGGVLFQDYMNYTSEEKFALENYDKAFEAGNLKKVSEINLEEIQVSGL
ncbi:hypothetical protein ABID22_003666 [Pontibacter aydingkolensis]|uniref:Deoxyribose-phosphate aldolase n=1 Tax=Pontibacter aydingkolensis TaxID=1911536 RepID=A0ABS7CYM4_9BACT|nr:DUF6503 family protein [Pontibacter aydingkolensis]MBW7468966.1 hypothetical protein [Pontibacter aydingkolensis]